MGAYECLTQNSLLLFLGSDALKIFSLNISVGYALITTAAGCSLKSHKIYAQNASAKTETRHVTKETCEYCTHGPLCKIQIHQFSMYMHFTVCVQLQKPLQHSKTHT